MNRPVEPVMVSVIVASFNASAFLRAAVQSALDQSLREIEVIIVDDRSTDDSHAIACDIARSDRRVRVDRLDHNSGPAAARNRGLDLAEGRYVAILDSDDLYHPERLKRLVSICEAVDADMIADDMILFDDENRTPAGGFLAGRRRAQGAWVTLADYFNETVLYGRKPNLGFLKPLIRLDILRDHAIRYDEGLRIAEDDELIIRLLRAGARYRTIAEPGYLYRKHGSSTSHRLSLTNVEAMLSAGERLAADMRDARPAERRGLRRRNRALCDTRDFTLAIDALKARRPMAALGLMLSRPGLLPLFRMPVMAKLKRIVKRASPPAAPIEKRACFISNQRLIGATNGSSAYLLDLARSTRDAGYEPHLVQPSPAIFGRLPFFRLRPEMRLFASHRIADSIRIGDWVIARDPLVYLRAATGIVRRIARRIGVSSRWTIDRPAPYAVTAPWTKAEQIFVTTHARANADIVIADYMFQARAFPFVARPEAPTAIVMHDLFHARSDGFAATGDSDSVTAISREAELSLLGKADAVIAIQAAEAGFIEQALPDRDVILAPMAARPVAHAQPGETDRLLFVGSNTAPNVHGLRWFFDHVWPRVRAHRPMARLDIAGSVAASFAQWAPEGVAFLGLVDDLAPLYGRAGLVVSPLIHGSGLKIKLVEALAQGKAVVATGITLQGVEDAVADAVIQADDPQRFADAIIRLMEADEDRAALAGRALDAARIHFSADICYRSFRGWLARNDFAPPPITTEEARLCA